MLSDVFLEYLIKREKGKKDHLTVAGIILAALIVSVTAFILGMGFFPAFSGIWFLLFAVIWYFAYIFISLQGIEFEYILTNSEFDIDKIAAKRKRTRVASFDFKKAEIVANINDAQHNNLYLNNNLKVLDFTSNSQYKDNVYFIIIAIDGERVMILFEPTSRMLENIHRFNPNNVFIQE